MGKNLAGPCARRFDGPSDEIALVWASVPEWALTNPRDNLTEDRKQKSKDRDDDEHHRQRPDKGQDA